MLPWTTSIDSGKSMADTEKDLISPFSQNSTEAELVHSYAAEPRADGKIMLQEQDCYESLGYSFSNRKKWTILSSVFLLQISMNFNASIYGSAVPGMKETWGISLQQARLGQMVFLIAYAFGCELWAPWSEEFGRKWILQASLFLVNLWQIPCALASGFGTILGFRLLGGLSSAGGSVTLGLVADMWEPDVQQYPLAFIVLASVAGSVVGPVTGGFVEAYLQWRWVFWIQLILGVIAQAIHFFCAPETRTSILLTEEAKLRRAAGERNVYSPDELREYKLTVKEVCKIWIRPFHMFLCEPIVLCLSLLSGFSDALIFTFLESYGMVFKQWKFNPVQLGLCFSPLLIGYVLAYFSFFPFFNRFQKSVQSNPNGVAPEKRLYWLLYTAPLETIGLLGFAWTSLGPAYGVPWIAPLIFSVFIAIANFAIYMATIDYMVAAYGPYSASATGGNGFARDFLAGIAAMYSVPLYEHFKSGHKADGGDFHLEIASSLLAALCLLITVPIYIFYWKGPQIRARSRFAQVLDTERQQVTENRTQRAQTKVKVRGSPQPRHIEDIGQKTE